jgi:hypothetical protein
MVMDKMESREYNAFMPCMITKRILRKNPKFGDQTFHMKKNLLIFSLFFSLQELVYAQGTIQFPVITPLAVSFVAISNSPAYYIPSGDGIYITGLSIDLNITAIDPTNTVPSPWFITATILQKNNDGSLTPMTFPGGNPAFNAEDAAMGITVYSSSGPELTSDQIQTLQNGQMFVESYFVYGTYLGQVALVPEPSIIGLLLFGAGFCALFRLVASFYTKPPKTRKV